MFLLFSSGAIILKRSISAKLWFLGLFGTEDFFIFYCNRLTCTSLLLGLKLEPFILDFYFYIDLSTFGFPTRTSSTRAANYFDIVLLAILIFHSFTDEPSIQEKESCPIPFLEFFTVKFLTSFSSTISLGSSPTSSKVLRGKCGTLL